MALIKCFECNEKVSDKAVSCPHCGYPIQEEIKRKEKEEELIKKVEKELHYYKELPMNLKKDKDFFLKIIKSYKGNEFIDYDYAYHFGREFRYIEYNSILYYADESIQDDYDCVLEVIKRDPLALEYASEQLKDDKSLAIIAVKQNGDALLNISDRLKKDREIEQLAIESGYPLEIAPDYISNNKEACLKSLNVDHIDDYGNLLNVSDELWDDKDFVLNALKINTDFVIMVSQRLCNDEDVKKVIDDEEDND